MDNLKFRVWSKRLKKFIHSDYLAISLDGNLIQRHICYNDDPDDFWDDSWTEVLDENEYVIQQFTGIKNQFMEDIYEGDIIQMNYSSGELGRPTEVVFRPESRVNLLSSFECSTQSPIHSKVIGNVFETPELLK